MNKILLIEDEPNVADNLVYALQTEGFEVRWCATGGEGREALEEDGYDLVVLDVGLPDIDGFTLCREIRRAREVAVLFLTARDSEIDRVVGLEIGGDDYVTKPFSPREVTARIKAILRRSGGRSQVEAEPGPAGSVAVDGLRMEARYRGAALELTRYEFRLLEALAGQPGRVFTREGLMEAAWEDPGSATERTVDTHIKRLRAKLREVDPDANPVQTVRGIGYTFRDAP